MKCVLFGDSITDGIGSKHINYEKELSKLIPGLEINNFAKSGETILYANRIKDNAINICPNFAVVFCGSVDGLIRANLNNVPNRIEKAIPNRYKRSDMLEQRPFYSKKFFKRIINRIDNNLRKFYKKLVLKYGGTYQRVDKETFSREYFSLIEDLNSNNIKCILISTMFLDDKYFLNSTKEFELYNKIIKKTSEHFGCAYIDLFNYFKDEVKKDGWGQYYAYDHFHPNENGYRLIATLISEVIKVM